MTFLERVKAARRAAVPILAIETADPAATINSVCSIAGDIPIMQWDIIRGLSGLNEAGSSLVNAICQGDNPALVTGNPSELLTKIKEVPENTMCFMHNAHLLLESQQEGMALPVIQGIWNLRDKYKGIGAMLILLAPAFRLPVAIKNDIMVLDEPYPTLEELQNITTSVAADAGIKEEDLTTEAVSKTLLGLSAFSAEQSLATSIKKNGNVYVDMRELWEKKCKSAEQTKGISVYRGIETYKDVIGYDNAKWFMSRIMKGPDAPEVYIFMDEIEKQLSGFGSDLSGVTGEMMGGMLTWMQTIEALGVLFIGGPGTGKSLIGQASGNEALKPTIIFNLSQMKGSLVGQSMSNLTDAQKMVNGMAGGRRVMIVATCNRFGNLPPELKRRFSLGTFFFDLPAEDERQGIWVYYIKKFGLKTRQADKFSDIGWTGAEIKNCCNIAWRLNCKLSEASNYIVPVCKSSADELENLQKMADGKFISASQPGIYKRVFQTNKPTGRKFE